LEAEKSTIGEAWEGGEMKLVFMFWRDGRAVSLAMFTEGVRELRRPQREKTRRVRGGWVAQSGDGTHHLNHKKPEGYGGLLN